MKTLLFKCPKCQRQHALSRMLTKGQKTRFGLCCDDLGRLHHTQFVPLPKSVLDNMDLDDPELLQTPEWVTPAAKKQLADRQTMGMALMLPQDGQQVERSVDLPRRVETDAQAATRFQAEIAEICEAIRENEQACAKLVRERQRLESVERETRAKLREVWTEPLNFGTA